MIYGTISCLGDSLTFGARSELGFPEHLAIKMNSHTAGHTEWAVLNHGISGQTTRQILDRAPGVTRELAGMAGAKLMVVFAGTNDSKGDGLDHALWTGLYCQILHWPRRYGIPMVLCTLPQLDPREMPVFSESSQAWIEKTNPMIRQTAKLMNNNPSPTMLCELADIGSDQLIDGVHLTSAGYEIVADRLMETIQCGPVKLAL